MSARDVMSAWRELTADGKADAIRAAHTVGCTAEALGRKLGCSRNAIIGVYTRRRDLHATHPLHESTNAKAARRPTPITAPLLEKKAKSMSGLKWVSTKVSDEPLPEFPPAPATARRCRLHEIERHECKWPVDEVDDVHLFCGLPKRPERVYCDEHHALAYRPVVKRLDTRDRKRSENDTMPFRSIINYGRSSLTKPSIKA